MSPLRSTVPPLERVVVEVQTEDQTGRDLAVAEQKYSSGPGDFVHVAYQENVAVINLLLWDGESREDRFEECIAEIVFVIPDPRALNWVFDDAVDDFVVESGEARPVLAKEERFGPARESRGRFDDDEVVYVSGECV